MNGSSLRIGQGVPSPAPLTPTEAAIEVAVNLVTGKIKEEAKTAVIHALLIGGGVGLIAGFFLRPVVMGLLKGK